jgi:hypothetical protein
MISSHGRVAKERPFFCVWTEVSPPVGPFLRLQDTKTLNAVFQVDFQLAARGSGDIDRSAKCMSMQPEFTRHLPASLLTLGEREVLARLRA